MLLDECAAIGECAVACKEIGVAQFDRTERKGRTGLIIIGAKRERTIVERVPDRVGTSTDRRLDCGNIQRALQRVTQTDRPTFVIIPSARGPSLAEIRRRIHEERRSGDRP